MTPAEAERIIESLRYGIPPRGHVREFTVGREAQIRELTGDLHSDERVPGARGKALLVKANWGAGKSHLLEVIREVALENNYVVSLIVANAQGGVRFNRMETILGEVCRQLEVPGSEGKGIGTLFSTYTGADERRLENQLRNCRAEISNNGRWDSSDTLDSPAMYVALRSWVVCDDDDRATVEARVTDWLHNPANYRAQRQVLYTDLVASLRTRFRDPRPDWRFYSDGVFAFHTMGYRQSWDALGDLDLLARLSGYRGLVLLVDEFEDVIQNLVRRDYKEAAFLNLFRFFRAEAPGISYFAVTPDFVHKCKTVLLSRGVFDYDYTQFDKLRAFEMEPIDADMLYELTLKVRRAHAAAYGWNAETAVPDKVLKKRCRELAQNPLPDRVRQGIVAIVKLLDEKCQA
jgi:hypothetical protein